MTRLANRAKRAFVESRVNMAGNTCFGCAYEYAIGMTVGTGDIDMSPGQRECGQVVIEGGRLPGCGGMAGTAIRSILAAVMVIGRMAGITSCRCAFELKIFMATSAENGGVRACQLKDGVGMIKRAGLPTSCRMAGLTLGAERAAMWIADAMTRRTGGGRANKEFIFMALSTEYSSMLTRQLEVRILVIESSRRPAAGCVTLRALSAEFAAMWIVLGMT